MNDPLSHEAVVVGAGAVAVAYVVGTQALFIR